MYLNSPLWNNTRRSRHLALAQVQVLFSYSSEARLTSNDTLYLDRLFLHRHWIFCISIIDCHLVISLQFKTDIARESRAISVFTCSDITRDRCPLYQIVKDTSKIDNGYQLFQPAFGYNVRSKPPDFSLQVYSSRSRPRQLQLPWSTSEEKPEIRELRSPGCPTETA